MSARRVGNTVELRFTAPWRSTDKLPLPGNTIIGTICRQLEQATCIIPPEFTSKRPISTVDADGRRNSILWTDTLPSEFTSGAPRLLAYRVEFFSPSGRSAGRSEAAYTATGEAPASLTGFQAEGSRLGIVLHWNPIPDVAAGVLFQRDDLTLPTSKPTPAKARSDVSRPTSSSHSPAAPPSALPADTSSVWLTTEAHTASAVLLDSTTKPDVSYRYTATRRFNVQIGGRSIEIRSSPAVPVVLVLHQVYPPPAPTGLTAVGFQTNGLNANSAPYAVDLIWQPIDDAGLITSFAGYNVYRQVIGADGQGNAPRQRQNSSPIPLPAFHDATALPTRRYLYSLTAIDIKGNESSAITAIVDPSSTTP